MVFFVFFPLLYYCLFPFNFYFFFFLFSLTFVFPEYILSLFHIISFFSLIFPLSLYFLLIFLCLNYLYYISKDTLQSIFYWFIICTFILKILLFDIFIQMQTAIFLLILSLFIKLFCLYLLNLRYQYSFSLCFV